MTNQASEDELDRILAEAIEDSVRAGMRYGTKQEREKIPMYPFSIDEPVVELRAAILDWHNKQIEAVIDRLEGEVQDIATSKPSVAYATSIATNKVLYTIEAERNKLKADPRLHYHGQGWPAACTLDHKLKESSDDKDS